MTLERLKEIEAWAVALQHENFPFEVELARMGRWLAELAAEVRRRQEPGDTVHLVAESGLGYVGRLAPCAEARKAGSMPCPLCKEVP